MTGSFALEPERFSGGDGRALWCGARLVPGPFPTPSARITGWLNSLTAATTTTTTTTTATKNDIWWIARMIIKYRWYSNLNGRWGEGGLRGGSHRFLLHPLQFQLNCFEIRISWFVINGRCRGVHISLLLPSLPPPPHIHLNIWNIELERWRARSPLLRSWPVGGERGGGEGGLVGGCV